MTISDEKYQQIINDIIESVKKGLFDPSTLDVEVLKAKHESSTIRQLKVKIKNILEKDTVKALKEIKKNIGEETSLFDDVIGLISRYNRVDKYVMKGVIAYEDAHKEFTKIDNSVIMLINEIDEDDFFSDKTETLNLE